MKIRNQFLLFALLFSGDSLIASDNGAVLLSSGNRQVALLELFTSEGCSSCPPADRWLSELKSNPRLWKNFTAIAFHVDYWDYIGWKDRFAQAEFSDRQRRYAAEGGTRVVYTPGFFVDGSDWRGWRTGREVAGANSEVGKLSVSIVNQLVAARFDPHSAMNGELVLHVAVLGMNLETRVNAGENTGKTLHHDFVALEVVSAPLDKSAEGYEAHLQLQDISENPNERAVVAWVTDKRTQTPIQSVGGFLPGR